MSDNLDEPAFLCSLTDAITARESCEFLESAGIRFALLDRSYPQSGLKRMGDEPPVILEIYVSSEDVSKAQDCLRASLGLFPRPEVDQSKESDEDEQIYCSVLVCDEMGIAEEVRQILSDRGIWCRVTSNDEAEISVDVDAVNVERATQVVQEWALGNTGRL